MRQSFRRVIVGVAKLRSYCLSETHLRGRHKAPVFRSRLGLDAGEAAFMRRKLLEAVLAGADDMVTADVDRYGQRYILDFEVTTAQGTAPVRSAWIVRTNDDVLRLVTCSVL